MCTACSLTTRNAPPGWRGSARARNSTMSARSNERWTRSPRISPAISISTGFSSSQDERDRADRDCLHDASEAVEAKRVSNVAGADSVTTVPHEGVLDPLDAIDARPGELQAERARRRSL